jgi:putative phage-type endonuclease
VLTEAQLVQRRNLLTASDVPAVLGLNPWRTALDVYLEKTGVAEPREDTWRSRRGHAVEPIILDAIAEKRGVHIARVQRTFEHTTIPWLGATPDALANVPHHQAITAVAEAKEVGVRVSHHWNDPETDEERVPDYVLIQGQVQITVLRTHHPQVDRALYGAWLPYEDAPRVVDVAHDPELEAAIVEGCEKFRRDHLLPRKPPAGATPGQQIALAKALFPKPVRPVLMPSDVEVELLAQQYIAARDAKKSAEETLEELKARFIDRIKDTEGFDGQGWRAKWRWQDACIVQSFERKAGRVFDFRTKKQPKETGR